MFKISLRASLASICILLNVSCDANTPVQAATETPIAGSQNLAKTAPLQATPANVTPYIERPEVKAFIDEMVRGNGLKQGDVVKLMMGARYQQPIINAISKPAEHALTWAQYRKIFITQDRIDRGVTFHNTHRDALKRAQKQFGVPAEMIVAIIGVETRYGNNKGNYRVIDALSTLAFDYPPRSKFFRQQLKEFMLLGPEAGIDLGSATGSYAGAIGYPQFMPSSYRAFAVDFDADNRIDLINDPTDAIGSVANYFHAHKWQNGQAVVKRAHFTGDARQQAALDALMNQGLKPSVPVSKLTALGLTTKTPLPGSTIVTPMKLEGAKGSEYWLGLDNLYVITRYNNSSMYAMAAHQLSKKIREKL